MHFPITLTKRFIYLTLVIGLAFVAYHYSMNPHREWIILSAVGLSFITTGNSFGRRIFLLVATAFWLIVTIFITGLIAFNPILLTCYLFVITSSCTYLAYRYNRWPYLFGLINFLTLASVVGAVTLVHSLERVQSIEMGAFIAIIAQLLFWPHFMRNEWRFAVARVLTSYKSLNNDIFSCLLQPEYPDNIYLFERRIHEQKKKSMMARNYMRSLFAVTQTKVNEENYSVLTELSAQLNLLYDLILDYALIRNRVTDHSTFELCADELTEISQAISTAFDELQAVFYHKNPISDFSLLNTKIIKLEENAQHVLQVAAREPLVFTLFINSLMELQKQLVSTYHIALKARAVIEGKA